MSDDRIDYRELRDRAERCVVRWALETAVGRDQPPGDHHFYITFDTQFPGVELSDAVRGRYPEEMTIILKTRFRDLEVDEEAFSVTLWFDQQPERVRVPFDAVEQFVDPSANLTLLEARPRALTSRPRLAKPAAVDAEIVSLDAFRRKTTDEE